MGADNRGLAGTVARGIPLVQLVMDYDKGDMAEGEVIQALCRQLPFGWQMNFTKANSFKTTETGFIAGQYALAPRSAGDPPLVIYINCAPRKDARSSRANNGGEELIYGELKNGVKIVGTNSKYSLSAMREHFIVLRSVKVDRGGSQFRSRDNFPPFVGAVARGDDLSSWLGAELDPHTAIPEFKEGYIGYIDSFGNIKTTFRASSACVAGLKPGQEIEVEINGTELVARVATGSFTVPEGNFAFSVGSSGWDDRFWEIFQRGGNAAQSFKNPQIGSLISLNVLEAGIHGKP
jgi:hypothetical protein